MEIGPEYFQKAFQALIHSCDVFRTIIQEIHGAPEPMLLSSFPYTMEYCDFTDSQDPDDSGQTWIHNRKQRVVALHIVKYG